METAVPGDRSTNNKDDLAAETAAATTRPRIDIGTTAIFECKQALVDLRRDNGCTTTTTRRLEKVHQRREVMERNLRVHYPAVRGNDSLFAEVDSHNFATSEHGG